MGNAETNWVAMLTLTYRVSPQPADLVRHRRAFLARLERRFPACHWAWILEFQRRGAPHYHLFFGDGGPLGVAIEESPLVTVMRHGTPTQVLCGDLARSLADWWIEIVSDTDPRFRAFQGGGILERMRSPDAAGRYAAKEAGKRVQKSLPPGWPGGFRWWGMCRAIKPRARGYGRLQTNWTGGEFALVWDKRLLDLLPEFED
jgi:hypothetical protein